MVENKISRVSAQAAISGLKNAYSHKAASECTPSAGLREGQGCHLFQGKDGYKTGSTGRMT